MTEPATASSSPGSGGAVTGHPVIDATLTALAQTRQAAPAEQVAPLREVHRVLRETLDTIGDV